nr:MAG TPA: hypothetical protein [Inoviridae sp.]
MRTHGLFYRVKVGKKMDWQMIFFLWGMLCAYVVVRGISG